MNSPETFAHKHTSLNALWSALLLEELWRLGVRHCCIAPGSRSAPLTLAAAEQNKLIKHTHFDERGLGYFALGLAKTSKTPVIIITTSGTAVANLYPAIIEARQSHVPLIALTADRPPELINCGANQAIDQQGIFGRYPGNILNLPTPSEDIPARWLLSSIDQAFTTSCSEYLPLHINCMFREPLYPFSDHDFSHYLAPLSHDWLYHTEACTRYQKNSLTILPDTNRPEIPLQPLTTDTIKKMAGDCGIIVVGRMAPGTDRQAVIRLAKTLGWPVIADIQSQIHSSPETLAHSDCLLNNPDGIKRLTQAKHIIQLGGFLLSKSLMRFLNTHCWEHYLFIDDTSSKLDPGHWQTHRIIGSVAQIGNQLSATLEHHISEQDEKSEKTNKYLWLQQLRKYSHQVSSFCIAELKNSSQLSQAWISLTLPGMLPDSATLFLGNSLPVRLFDLYAENTQCSVLTNRGTSGIDGLLATAAGCATGMTDSSSPLVTVIGDTSFLYDLNSLSLMRTVRRPVIIVLLNNDGGEIFRLLPLGKAAHQVTQYFQIPHGLDGFHAASMFGLSYHCVKDQREFCNTITQALTFNSCSIIEVKTPAGQAAKQIRETIRQAGEK
ncbi:2-succinyl-5-enolpyruvyl-6-hydroxy-3-cyclohexene-1-carboxylate synthase [invertebrate metagenome]|uniref:2-succinyl-5-enolpyruvyl-6-hydroxy-3-cyclohexene-1-carboxylate synthase n=1 Tax=invertebrate metagenome TaxID=1711999 RepID=A0A2H9TAN3_9ZZZZ